jgi:hypothetical protein
VPPRPEPLGDLDHAGEQRSLSAMAAERASVPKVEPGLAFSIVCDLGFAVGLATHHIDRIGHLVWIAEPIFDEEPTIQDVEKINQWRWPVFFLLGAAVRRKSIIPIGAISIPPGLEVFPLMRGGNKTLGWRIVTFTGGRSQTLGPAADPTLPIYKIVNEIRLREMLVSEWKPEHEW